MEVNKWLVGTLGAVGTSIVMALVFGFIPFVKDSHADEHSDDAKTIEQIQQRQEDNRQSIERLIYLDMMKERRSLRRQLDRDPGNDDLQDQLDSVNLDIERIKEN